jgi:hypothetical protein
VDELQPDNISSSLAARSARPGGTLVRQQDDVVGGAHADNGGRLQDGDEVTRWRQLKRMGIPGFIARQTVIAERGEGVGANGQMQRNKA